MRGRPRVSKGDYKLVWVPFYVWERLKELSGKDTPMWKVVRDAVSTQYGGIFEPGLDIKGQRLDFIPLMDAIAEAEKQHRRIAPRMAVTAIQKGLVPGERRKVGMSYTWFVDYTELVSYCRKRQFRKGFETKDRQRRELKKLAELKEKYDKPIPEEG